MAEIRFAVDTGLYISPVYCRVIHQGKLKAILNRDRFSDTVVIFKDRLDIYGKSFRIFDRQAARKSLTIDRSVPKKDIEFLKKMRWLIANRHGRRDIVVSVPRSTKPGDDVLISESTARQIRMAYCPAAGGFCNCFPMPPLRLHGDGATVLTIPKDARDVFSGGKERP